MQPIGCLCGFDNGFYVTAGHDESSTWQEFGEMMFQTRDDIPDAFGPPRNPDGSAPLNQLGQPMTNWADTRYVDWTSWRAAANHWPNAGGGTSTQAESSGQSVFAHEFSHLRGLPDNYNNPFADNERNFTGYWEMMSRGTFNGPGGTHNRWQVPNQGGSGLGPHHLLHFKNQLSVLAPTDQVTFARDTLQTQGVALVELKAREAVPDGELVGATVTLGTGDLAGTCANQGLEPFYCPNRTGGAYLHYRLEVVDRVGNDSFIPGHGVLLTKSRNSGTPRVWMIDPNPQDIGMIDFYRPDGTPVAVVRGDPRQLNDATFHAGTRSGSAYEYVDTFNKLHFYVLSTRRDADGVLHYRVAVRRCRATGDPFTRGVGPRHRDEDAAAPGLPRDVHLPADEHGPGRCGPVRPRRLPRVGNVEQRRLEGDGAERARRRDRRSDGAGAGARAPRPAHRRGRCPHDGDADGEVRGGRVEDGDADVQRPRPGHDACERLAGSLPAPDLSRPRRVRRGRGGRGRRRRPPRPGPRRRRIRRAAGVGTAGARVRRGARRRDAHPRQRALARPARPARLHGELLRPLPRDPPCGGRGSRRARRRRRGCSACVGEDDDSGGAEYAEELDLGHPVASAGERVWLNYAAREPGLVVLVAPGGEVVRGWPNGVTAAVLSDALDDLIEP